MSVQFHCGFSHDSEVFLLLHLTVMLNHGDVADSGLWKHPLMLYTKEALREPLTTLPSIDLQRKAAELFKVKLLSWQPGIYVHVMSGW